MSKPGREKEARWAWEKRKPTTRTRGGGLIVRVVNNDESQGGRTRISG